MQVTEMSNAQVSSGLKSAIKATSSEKLFGLLVNMAYKAITSGRVNDTQIKDVRESNLPKEFRMAAGKFLPARYCDETEKYRLDRSKILKILKSLGFEQDGLAECRQRPDFDKYFSFEEFAANFPNPFEKKAEKKESTDSVDKLVKNVESRLTKLKISNAKEIAQVVQLLANDPERLKELTKDLLK